MVVQLTGSNGQLASSQRPLIMALDQPRIWLRAQKDFTARLQHAINDDHSGRTCQFQMGRSTENHQVPYWITVSDTRSQSLVY